MFCGGISRTPVENLTLVSVSLSSMLILRSSDFGAKPGDIGVGEPLRWSCAGSRSMMPCSCTNSLELYSSCIQNTSLAVSGGEMYPKLEELEEGKEVTMTGGVGGDYAYSCRKSGRR